MNPLVLLLRIGGTLNLVLGVLAGVWYWNVFNTILTIDPFGGSTVDQVTNPWALAVGIAFSVEGFFTFVVFMAIAQVLVTCRDNQSRIIRLSKHQHELQQTVDEIAASA